MQNNIKPNEIDKRADKFISEIKDITKRKIAEARKKDLIANYFGDDEMVCFEDTIKLVATQKPREVISTGFHNLNEDLGGGFYIGDLVLMGGTQGNGKTNFCFNLTKNMEKYNPCWLPFEETADEYAEKMLRWKQDGFKFYHPKKMIREDIGWIEDKILEAKLKFDSKVVFIDNLHFITMSDNQESYFMKLGMTAKMLKKIAQKMNICIILIVHLRKTTLGMTEMPTMDDIAGSSDIAKVANTVIMLWREAKREDRKMKFTGNTFIGIQKCRSGAKQDNHLFSWDKGNFKEMSMESYLKDLEIEKTKKPNNIF